MEIQISGNRVQKAHIVFHNSNEEVVPSHSAIFQDTSISGSVPACVDEAASTSCPGEDASVMAPDFPAAYTNGCVAMGAHRFEGAHLAKTREGNGSVFTGETQMAQKYA